jgi:pyruvate/2-oxoglutarate dehydrogenase complex dihydrolipoamide dehydrogenase (E3) component
MDEQVSIAVETRLKENGVEIILNANIEQVTKGEVIMVLRETNTRRTVMGSLVVICTGRKLTFDYESLRHIGIAIDHEKSSIIIDEETCRTSVPNIYACGGVVSSCWTWVRENKSKRFSILNQFSQKLGALHYTSRLFSSKCNL